MAQHLAVGRSQTTQNNPCKGVSRLLPPTGPATARMAMAEVLLESSGGLLHGSSVFVRGSGLCDPRLGPGRTLSPGQHCIPCRSPMPRLHADNLITSALLIVILEPMRMLKCSMQARWHPHARGCKPVQQARLHGALPVWFSTS